MISDRQRIDLIKSKARYMKLFDDFLGEIIAIRTVDKQNFNKLLEGLKKIILVQLANLKNEGSQIILNAQVDDIKKLTFLIKDIKQNKNLIINVGNNLRDEYKKEKYRKLL